MSYTHLSYQDRVVISHLQGNVSLREIARRIGRSHSTISRGLTVLAGLASLEARRRRRGL